MADIELVSRTQTSLTCRATDLPDNAYYIRWYIAIPGNEQTDFPWNGSLTIGDADWPCWTFTHVGDAKDDSSTWIPFEPNTTYAVKISVRASDQSAIGNAITRYFTTQPERPANWAWESIVSSGRAINMTAAEFNRFVDRVSEFINYVYGDVGVDASSYYVTKGTRMRAIEVNAVRALINTMYPETPVQNAAVSGETITAAFFNGLMNSLNSIE